MDNDEKDRPDIYQISELNKPAETTLTPSKNSDIFAVKKEHTGQLGSIISMALSAGVFLCNAYRLDKRIVRDERGEIWQAADLEASRNVSVSLPPPDIRKDESAIEPVRQTAKRVEALDHPRIVPVRENLTDPEHGFFTVRKLVSGNTLDLHWQEYVQQHKKSAPAKVVKMLNDIAHALDYAHSVDIIHGDLCPKNITVGQDGEVYLDNFALLPVSAENVSITRKPYWAPEIVEGESATIFSDTYALAVIAYQLFSGRLPVSQEHGTPLPIPGVPSGVDAVIRKAMSKDADDRYDSCGTFVKALEESFREPPKIKPVPIMPKSKVPKKKPGSRILLLVVMLLFGLLIGGTVACFIYYDVGSIRSNYLVPPIPEPLPEPAPESTPESDETSLQESNRLTPTSPTVPADSVFAL